MSNAFLSDCPFSPKVDNETMKVSFTKGFIFDCYCNYFDDDASLGSPSLHFSQGPSFFQSSETEYDFNYNDFFYLDSSASIFKLTNSQREDHVYMRNRFGDNFPNYLIWKAPSNANSGGEHIISENIFLQDKASGQKKGFQTVVIKNTSQGAYKRIYGGLVTIEDGHFQGIVQGLDYFLSNGENEKVFKIKVELTADVQSVSQIVLDNVNIVSGPLYIRDYSVTSVSIVESKDGDEDSPANVSSPQGIYYINLSGELSHINLSVNEMYYDAYFEMIIREKNIPKYAYTTELNILS